MQSTLAIHRYLSGIALVMLLAAAMPLQAGRTNLPAPSTITIAVDPVTYLITGPRGVLFSNNIANVIDVNTAISNAIIPVASEAQSNTAAVNVRMPAFTGRWSMVYSDGATNKQELPLGLAGTYLQSGGLTNVPIWDIPRVAATNLFLRDIKDTIAVNNVLVGNGSNATPRSLDYMRTNLGFVFADHLPSELFRVDNWFADYGDSNRLWYGQGGDFWITFDTNVVSTFDRRYLASITNLTVIRS